MQSVDFKFRFLHRPIVQYWSILSSDSLIKRPIFGLKFDFCIRRLWPSVISSDSLIDLSWFSVLKGRCHEIFDVRFSSWISPVIIPLGLYQIFPKIRGDICSSRCTTGVVDTGGKWRKLQSEKLSLFFLTLLGRWHRWQIFATSINNTSRTGGKICCRCRWY